MTLLKIEGTVVVLNYLDDQAFPKREEARYCQFARQEQDN
ncbi:MAG: hypothetical protein NEHIOOID_01335 [Holosporales bacterium]